MKTTQTLASGIIVRQDFRDSTRFVMFDTGYPEWEYATHGGTAFIVNYQGRLFGITCKHVLSDFHWQQIAITDTKFGKKIAGLSSVYYPSSPNKEAAESDILDVAVIQFSEDVDANFFEDNAYIVAADTICRSEIGDGLEVNGALKDKSSIIEGDIRAVFALIEFSDANSTSDSAMREANAKLDDPAFESLVGLSGAPVFNVTRGKICGMVMRGTLKNNNAIVRYIEIIDIVEIPKSIIDGSLKAQYVKQVSRPVTSS